MATTIVTKYGGDAPAASDIVRGELAVDTENGRLYTENSSGAVVELGLNPEGNVNVTGTVTSGAHLINAASTAFGASSVQGFNTDFLVDTGQGYARHNSYHTGGSNHQFLVNEASSTTNAVAFSIAKDKSATFSGNVGIGTGSSFGKLRVEDTGWSSGSPYGTVAYILGGDVNDANWGHLLLSQSGTTTDTGGRLAFGANGENPIAGIRAKYKGATYGDLAFSTRPSGGTNTERLVISSTGSVGIGVANGDVTSDGTAARTYVGIIGTANRGRLNIGSTASNGADSGVVSFVNGANELGALYMDTNSGSQTVGKMYLTSTEDLTLDAANDIVLDADGSTITFKDGGTTRFNFNLDATPDFVMSGGNASITAATQDASFTIIGNDGGNDINALSFDMSAAGAATFNGPASFIGQNTSHGASRLKISQESTAISQLRFYGADTSTAGILQFMGSSSNGSVGGERMRISADGEVTMPSQPAFQVKKNAGQNDFAVGSNVTVLWQTEIFDVGSNFASNTFTAPVTGKYQLNAHLLIQEVDTAADYYQLQIQTSNRIYYDTMDPAIGAADYVYQSLNTSVLADMDAGDTAHVVIYQSQGTAQSDLNSTTCVFSGYLVA